MSVTVPMVGSRSANAVSLLVKGQPWQVLSTDSRFHRIFDAFRDHKDDPDLEDILYKILTLDGLNDVIKSSNAEIEIVDDILYYEGEPLHSLVAERIVELYNDGLDVEPMMKFVSRLMRNPSKHVVDKLYNYLEQGGLHISEDGQFLAYKRVNSDMSSWHKNKDGSKLYNYVGTTVKCKRREVDDDHTKDCSYGLHVGTPQFVRSNQNFGPVVLLCSVPPECVVTVPEYDTQKLRTCEYTVVKQVDAPDNFTHYVYDKNGDGVTKKVVWADVDWDNLADEFQNQNTPQNTCCSAGTNVPNDNWKSQKRDCHGRFTR